MLWLSGLDPQIASGGSGQGYTGRVSISTGRNLISSGGIHIKRVLVEEAQAQIL